MSAPDYINENELAERWGMKAQTLSVWRHKGEGPAYYKIGRSVRYSMQDVLAYEQQQKIHPEKATQQ